MRVTRFFLKNQGVSLFKGGLRVLGVFMIFGSLVSPSLGAPNPQFDGSVPSYSWSKSTFGNVTYWELDPPNILFLIDTSGSMTFDKYDGYTYGDGSRPWYAGGYYGKQYYWGRDTDGSNNDSSLSANYHPFLTTKGEDARGGELSSSLIPNDSRLYILRNVLYRLFTERMDLLKGVNIAIGTYNQSEGNVRADWYYDYRTGSYQRINWNGSTKGMNLRFGLISAVDPATGEIRQNLVELFDGTEMPNNPEIRADGATPLAAAIYPEGNQAASSAYDFFKNRSGTYDGICQANWLVMMTDGADTASNRDPHEAVRLLYQRTSGNRSLKDKENNDLYYPVRTMAIGFINSADLPGLAKELDLCADIGFDGKEDSVPLHAYYADNFEGLFAAFEDIIISIKEMSGRKSPPKLRAGLPGIKGDVYVPEMIYWETKLWEGKLHKFILDYDGSMGNEAEWESSFPTGSGRVILTANWYGAGGGYGDTNLVSFKDFNWGSVVDEMGIRYALSENALLAADDASIEFQTKCFIRWYRGEEPSCANWEQRKSPMADMDRSGIAIVGIPQASWGDGKYIKFKEDNEKRSERLYIQSSEGMLHSFNTETGGEEWAFIPPQALRWARIAGLRAIQLTEEGFPSFWKWNWYGNYASKTDEALPREILGGPLVAEDVLVKTIAGEKYATVLLGSMGYGGYGLYALDVTDVNKPRFLWAIENAVALEPEVGQTNPFLPEDTSSGTEQAYPLRSLLHWEGKTTNTTPSATFRSCATLDGIFQKSDKTYLRSEDTTCTDGYFTAHYLQEYEDLAFVLGNPFLGRAFLKAGNDEDSLVFLGFTGAGVRENLASGSESLGCAIYAFSLKDGSLHAAWGREITDFYSSVSSYLGVEVPNMGMVYAPLSVKLTSQRTMEHFFVPDSNGYIHQMVFSEEGESLAQEDWKHRTPVYLYQGSPLVIPHKMPVGKIGEARWLFGGTKNVDTPSGQLENPRHYILGIKVSAYCDEDPCGLDCTDKGDPITMANLKVLDATISEDQIYIDNTLCGCEKDGGDMFWGWQIPLLEEDVESPQGEYVSASPALSDLFGRLFVATFEPYQEVFGSGENPCAEPKQDGMGRIYLLDAISGASDWPGEVPEGRKYLELSGVHITGMGVYDTFADTGDGETRPVTRIVITFLATDEAQEALREGGELREDLENAGVSDLNTDTDGMLSGAIALSEEKSKKFFGGSGTMEPTPTVIPIFWKNN